MVKGHEKEKKRKSKKMGNVVVMVVEDDDRVVNYGEEKERGWERWRI